MGQRAATAAGGEHNLTAIGTHFFGVDNFVGEGVFEEPVLVNAGGMRKRIGPHNRLIGLHRYAHGIGHQAADGIEQLCFFNTITTSSREVLPALSPRPLMVHSIWRAPPITPAMELAVARPRSLWQWQEMTALSILDTLLTR